MIQNIFPRCYGWAEFWSMVDPVCMSLVASSSEIRNKEGDNDGVVSVESARFGERRENWNFLEVWPRNHFRQINWGTNIVLTPSEENDNTIVEKYTALAARLRNLQL